MSFRVLGFVLFSKSDVNALLKLIIDREYNFSIILLNIFLVLSIIIEKGSKLFLSPTLKERGYKVNLYAVPFKLVRVYFKVEVVVLKEETDL